MRYRLKVTSLETNRNLLVVLLEEIQWFSNLNNGLKSVHRGISVSFFGYSFRDPPCLMETL